MPCSALRRVRRIESVKVDFQEQWMQQALGLARKGSGLTRPNPPVGAVIVRDGTCIGEGWHQRAGGPHAEIQALQSVEGPVQGAELFVTLEPCSTQGRTPPCTDAILDKGFSAVHIGTLDPNPAHAGRAVKILQQAGIRVVTGVCQEDAEELIDPFRIYMEQGRPRVLLKIAATLDGRIADRKGTSRWITGSEARTAVQGLRRDSDAVLIGAQTLLKDDPSLRPRPAYGRAPFRVVVDSSLSAPLSCQLYADRWRDRTLVFCGTKATERKINQLRGAGVRVHSSRHARFPLPSLLKVLAGEYGCLQVLCEGGGLLAESLLKNNLVDRIHWFTAPVILGGDQSIPSVGGKGQLLDKAWAMEFNTVETLGRDLWIRAVPTKEAS